MAATWQFTQVGENVVTLYLNLPSSGEVIATRKVSNSVELLYIRASASFYFALVNLTKECKISLVKCQMA